MGNTSFCCTTRPHLKPEDTKKSMQYCEDNHIIKSAQKGSGSSSKDNKNKRTIQKKNETKQKLDMRSIKKISSQNPKKKKVKKIMRKKSRTHNALPLCPFKQKKTTSSKTISTFPSSAVTHQSTSSLPPVSTDDLTKQFIFEMKQVRKSTRAKVGLFNSTRKSMHCKDTIKEVGLQNYREYCDYLRESMRHRNSFFA
ncbi:unnamed protein product [Moneuplotes crassus]|uniref:Uncharacterized protein n=1 Tax=Euplotes crassus TaxID=5936 RepID=A0AAD1U9B6_EUPCR|nr:unnamed protein product [Moneuplotes crassus]